LKSSLTQYLACATCKGDLTLEITQTSKDLPWQEIEEGYLNCQQCNKNYSIKGGIPRLLPDHQMPIEVQRTVDGFGYEWQAFNDQIKNAYMSDRKNFYDFIFPMTENFFKGKIVLDAGCGMGRFLKLGAEFGSREIIGMDLSTSVEAAYRNTRHISNAHVVQGDILTPPFKKNFDYIFSIGVLQFLSNPQKGFQELIKLLKRGGQISIWVYSKENNEGVIRILSPIRKHITSRISKPLLYFISHILGIVQFPILKIIYKPANEWGGLKKIGSKLPKNEYLYYNSQLSYREIVSVIFDQLAPQLVVYLSKDEIIEWFEMEGLTSIDISSRNNMSWRAHGTT
jgi:SAM-dependent methyltransferase